jgi:hypothetical protein
VVSSDSVVFMLSGMFLVGVPLPRCLWSRLHLIVISGLRVAIVGCGGTFTVTITGTSGGLTHNLTFTLNTL